MTIVTFQKRKGCRHKTGIVKQVHRDYCVVVSGGKFWTIPHSAIIRTRET